MGRNSEKLKKKPGCNYTGFGIYNWDSTTMVLKN